MIFRGQPPGLTMTNPIQRQTSQQPGTGGQQKFVIVQQRPSTPQSDYIYVGGNSTINQQSSSGAGVVKYQSTPNASSQVSFF